MIETKINFVCPKCTSINRVPDNRIDDKPICAKCKTGLTSFDHPIELDDSNFEKFISRSDSLIIVDFWAPWCGPCKMMANDYALAATALAPDFLLSKLDTQESNQTSSQFNITGIPCLIAFRRGKEIARQSGMMKAEQIILWARSL